MKKRIFLILLITSLLTGCSGTPGALGVGWPIPALVPIVNVSQLPKIKLKSAEEIKFYRPGEPHPEIVQTLGKIEGYSVKHLLWEPSPTETGALLQLKIKALNLGANGIVNISFRRGGLLEMFSRDSWESIKAEGIAVKFNGGDMAGE